jgi:cell division septation protein DedD
MILIPLGLLTLPLLSQPGKASPQTKFNPAESNKSIRDVTPESVPDRISENVLSISSSVADEPLAVPGSDDVSQSGGSDDASQDDMPTGELPSNEETESLDQPANELIDLNSESSELSESNDEPILLGQPDDSPYVVAIPARRDGLLEQVQDSIPTAFLTNSRRGQYIQVGAFPRRSLAEELSGDLRDQGFDARVVYFPVR